MGLRGPRPKPTALIRQSSCSFRGWINKGEPMPTPGRPACPKWLDPEAKKMWRKLLPHLELMRVLTVADGNALARYCETWARWKRLVLFNRQYGETYQIKRPDGNLACFLPFPQTVLLGRIGQELTRLEQEFGLTPSARSKITLSPIPVRMTPTRWQHNDMMRRLFEGGGPAPPRQTPEQARRRKLLFTGGGSAPPHMPSPEAAEDERRRQFLAGGGPAPPRTPARTVGTVQSGEGSERKRRRRAGPE